ncbi:MAG: hypothetical protein QM726_12955 [Chitinophagaceae bacterium]
MQKKNGGLLGTLKNILIPEKQEMPAFITSNDILDELLACFDRSCKTESVGSSLLFNMHFLVILHPDVYEQRLASFPIIVKEAVKNFYKKLQAYKSGFEEISPVSSLWQFRFGPASHFNTETIGMGDMKVIGMLTGLKTGNGVSDGRQTAKVTMKSKATNVFDKMDINLDVLRHIHFAENGNFTVKFNNDLSLIATNTSTSVKATRNRESGIARIEYFMGDKNINGVYLMKDTEIVIARREPENELYNNYLLLDSGYVSNPHARIRLNETNGKFQIASFSAHETRLNETIVERSDAANPGWIDMQPESQVLLNGIITLTFKQQP